MKAIVAVDQNWAIGYLGQLLEHIPEDMRFFKQMTIGKVVIMGENTFNSLPGRKPLKDRINLVLSDNRDFAPEGVTVFNSLEDLLQQTKKYLPEDVFVIGGQAVYHQLLPYCDEVYVTRIEKEYIADKYFENLDELPEWEMVAAGEKKHHNGIPFRFTKYVRRK